MTTMADTNALVRPSLHQPGGVDCLDIGLVNNMPDAALERTEQQFRSLIARAAGEDMGIRLHLYSLPAVPRGDRGAGYLAGRYSGIEELHDRGLDAVIVTGAEPRAADLDQEPYWDAMAGLFDWAAAQGVSILASCLAAHAAVQHFDGIRRRPLPQKRFGVFDHAPVSPHALLHGVQGPVPVAHSRWNEVAEPDLAARGYTVLTRSEHAGVDCFTKQHGCLMLLFQGHPEYGPDSLLREYRRDVGRFLRRERPTYPGLPHGYFKPETEHALRAFETRMLQDRPPGLLGSFPDIQPEDTHWERGRAAATAIYRNWLLQLARRHTP